MDHAALPPPALCCTCSPQFPLPAGLSGTWHPYWRGVSAWVMGDLKHLVEGVGEGQILPTLFIKKGVTYLRSVPADVAKGAAQATD